MTERVRFWLGTHQPYWLKHTSVPLFVSRRRLYKTKTLPRALGAWALDSGGFSELTIHGKWTVPPAQYVDEVRRFRDEVGNLRWAAIQDWMCEPHMLEKTGRQIWQHQASTCDSYEELRARAPELPWTPVIQGWKQRDYFDHIDEYARRGIDLTTLPVVGVGSVCRRQGMDEAVEIVKSIAARGIRVHGFGFKLTGLTRAGRFMESSDSMAWSLFWKATHEYQGRCR